MKELMKNVYKKKDERSLNETVKTLLGDIYNEIDKDECLEQTVGFLNNVYVDLDKESQQRLKKRQLLRKKRLTKRKQKIKKIALNRKTPRKEDKLLQLKDATFNKESCLDQSTKSLIESVYCELWKKSQNHSTNR